MKRIITVFLVSMIVVFAACKGGDYNAKDNGGGGGTNPPASVCPNDKCEVGENFQNCFKDCHCGDDICNAGETTESCPKDCPVIPPCTANARSIQVCYSMNALLHSDTTSTDYKGSAGVDSGTDEASYTWKLNIQPFRVDGDTVCWETSKFELGSITGVVDMTIGDATNDRWVGHKVHPTSITVNTYCGDTLLEATPKPVPLYVAKKTFIECILSGDTTCTAEGDGTFGYPVCVQGSLRGGWKNICTLGVNGAVVDCYNDNETIVSPCDLIYDVIGCYDATGNVTHQCVADGSTAP